MVKTFIIVFVTLLTAQCVFSFPTTKNITSNCSVNETFLTFKNAHRMYKLNVKPAGNYIKFKCQAEGNPTPNITWLINNKVPNRSLGDITYSRWGIMLEDLDVSDSGYYTCIVCNIKGCINFTRKLEVIERLHSKPQLKVTQENQTRLVGENVFFTCEFISDLHIYIQWVNYPLFNETDLEIVFNNTDKYMMKNKSELDHPSILMLTNVTSENEGWYSCIGQNHLGYTFASAYLKVLQPTSTLMPPYVPSMKIDGSLFL